ncbi:hypothetical protein GQ53DRAFT_284843 [Thozetella sp. PMI_491]|nr:hypothetical protein GQ53DRAFT_284843 [Thozetella sp. PMI_491]
MEREHTRITGEARSGTGCRPREHMNIRRHRSAAKRHSFAQMSLASMNSVFMSFFSFLFLRSSDLTRNLVAFAARGVDVIRRAGPAFRERLAQDGDGLQIKVVSWGFPRVHRPSRLYLSCTAAPYQLVVRLGEPCNIASVPERVLVLPMWHLDRLQQARNSDDVQMYIYARQIRRRLLHMLLHQLQLSPSSWSTLHSLPHSHFN